MGYDMLFSPMKIGSCEIKNRVVMAPMLMGFGQLDGKATKQMMDYYEERAKGGTGLIITEITRIDDKTGAAAFKQLGISHDYQIKPLSQMADRIHSHGAKLFVELHHPGRQNLGLLVNTVPLSIGCNRVMPFF
jgi:2,4-dienoyl-CoA reductase-like NADH-dependent reductase (Old Yellow Enzyme family)